MAPIVRDGGGFFVGGPGMPWIKVPKTSSIEITDTVTDIKAHMGTREPNFDFQTDERYALEREWWASQPQLFGSAEEDIGTWAHETNHQINNRIRNAQPKKSNAGYWLRSKAFVHEEPAGFTLKDVAVAVPADMRGSGYDLYMIQQQRWWNDHPLYVIDELACYKVGTLARIEKPTPSDASYSCSLFIEFIGYLGVAARLTDIYELKQLAFVSMSDAAEQIEMMENSSRDLTGQLKVVDEYINRDGLYY
jgi:hypothetical protein